MGMNMLGIIRGPPETRIVTDRRFFHRKGDLLCLTNRKRI